MLPYRIRYFPPQSHGFSQIPLEIKLFEKHKAKFSKKGRFFLPKYFLFAIMNSTFTKDIRDNAENLIEPDIVVHMDTDFSGCFTLAGDITGDGDLELVSARNDKQEVTALGAYDQKGNNLWTWGEAGGGKAKLGYDVPVQLYDWFENGNKDVIFSKRGNLVILDGKSGKLSKKYPLPKGLEVADCICFANLMGNERATDVIIKSRYKELWAYTREWEMLWKWKPWFNKTCHYPLLVDIDNDGKHEVFAGHKMLNNNGKVLWKLKSRKLHRKRGHHDASRVVKTGKKPEDFRIVITYCGANYIALLDGTGKVLWEDTGKHFESIDVGHFNSDYPAPQFYVDIDHTDFGEALGYFYDYTGRKFGVLKLGYGRQHRSLDWTGNGLEEVLIANELAIVNGKGERIADLKFETDQNTLTPPQKEKITTLHMGIYDFTENGGGDLMIFSEHSVNVYFNPNNQPSGKVQIEDQNYTFY